MIHSRKIPKRVFLHLHPGLSEMELLAAGQITKRLEEMGAIVSSRHLFLLQADLAIIFGTAKFRLTLSHIVKLIVSRLHPNFMVFESPVVGRVTQELGHKEPLFRVGLGGFFADYGFAYATANQQDGTAQRLLLGESFRTPKIEFGRQNVVGIALQIPGDASIVGVDQVGRLAEIVRQIRSSKYFSNARIIVRTPPLLASFTDSKLIHLSKTLDLEIQVGTNDNKESFFQLIEFLVTFSSTMGIDAIMRGVPACGLDPRSFLCLVSSSTLDDLLSRRIDLNPYFMNILANTTWRIEDIFGLEFQRIVVSSIRGIKT
jgi:hypothetical protein